MTSSKIKIRLTKSVIAKSKKQKATISGLGLRRVNSISVLNDTAEVRGMINKVSHLVEVID